MEIDARKLSCPTPVLLAKDAIENSCPEWIEIIVDNEAANQNVSRFLTSQAYMVETLNEQGLFRVKGTRSENTLQNSGLSAEPRSRAKKIMVMVATDRLGYGDDDLGGKLMINFIKTLKEMQPELWKLVFVNNGVKLSVEGSAVLPELKALIENGTDILVCGTCLTHFNLLEKKEVGETTNMLDIVTAMQLADKVINI
jgi:selenium metabolism protein YedF